MDAPVDRPFLAWVAELTDPARRAAAARAVAAYIGGDALVIFIWDPGVATLLPAPGFPQTLPGRASWQQLLESCARDGWATGAAALPDRHEPLPATAVGDAGSVAVVLGAQPVGERLAELRLLLPVLAAAFRGEQAAGVAAAQVDVAEQSAAQATQLATALDRARRQLRDALDEAQRARADVALLAELSGKLASSLDLDETLVALGAVLVPAYCDGCLVLTLPLQDEAGRVDVSGVDQALTQQLRAGAEDLLGCWRAGDGTAAAVVEAAVTRLTPLAGGLTAGVLTVPLLARDRTLGLLVLLRRGPARVFRAIDRQLAEELGHRAAVAIDNARLYRQARQAVQDRDTFLSVAAHELRTPMTSLRGYAQFLLRQERRGQPASPERLQQTLGLIEQQTRRLSVLVDQLLDVSRLESGQLALERRPTDLAELVRKLTSVVQLTVSSHRIRTKTPERLVVSIDPLRIEQVLTNLLENAVKYAPPSEILVELRQPAAGRVRLRVRDQGPGVPAAIRARVFEPFYRLRDAPELPGLGLGLHITRQIVELHGGRIWVAEGEAEGADFVVELPVGPLAPPSTGA